MKKKKPELFHKSVMLEEAINSLHINKRGRYIDATLGYAGHAGEILRQGGTLLGIEQDKEALARSKKILDRIGGEFTLMHSNFTKIREIAKSEGFWGSDGILFDLGVSSPQLTSRVRGFSYADPGAFLDMRMDRDTQKVTASDLLNALREDQLARLFEDVLGYPGARKIAMKIIEMRETKAFETVRDFLQCIGGLPKKGKINPATKAFLALRMAVNSELENLKDGLRQAFEIVKKGGVIAVITFHSSEDRIVKDFFRDWVKKEMAEYPGAEFIQPGKIEISENRRSRSAKLRVIKKL